MTVSLYEGDCSVVLKNLADHSIDSVVTDPPFGLEFMQKAWDHAVPAVGVWREVLRVLKPGGHLLAFAGTRTYHRMVVAIEDAGFDIRDQIGWLFGGGMPKSHELLKPAWEPIVLARKPLVGSVVRNVALYGTGALNIDACRVPAASRPHRIIDPKPEANGAVYVGRQNPGHGFDGGSKAVGTTDMGRWPANILHDGSEPVLEAFAAYGNRGAAAPVKGTEPSRTGDKNTVCYGLYDRVPSIFYGDEGTAARFFYCAKTSKSERSGSKHPTIKPVSLMRYLCKLVTPAGGTVLDPFAGSGSTGQAAIDEGYDAILIEQDATYCNDIRRRLAGFLGTEALIQFVK